DYYCQVWENDHGLF
nr:immunoglobulin light chain junction region [Macaca mulatta]MOX75266.1 immunoglobulin light chain junction region [Macaca mulatta]MOX76122.1 immunoglobulin light chain junction region [Macaca mulatta]